MSILEVLGLSLHLVQRGGTPHHSGQLQCAISQGCIEWSKSKQKATRHGNVFGGPVCERVAVAVWSIETRDCLRMSGLPWMSEVHHFLLTANVFIELVVEQSLGRTRRY